MSQLSDKILAASNGGLDIILNYYPNAKPGRNFKIREERTASASLKQHESGAWLVTDFGDDSKPRNAIAVFAMEEGLSFREAVIQLGSRYGLLDQNKAIMPEIRKLRPTEVDYLEHFTDSGHYFEFKTEFTNAELDVLGPLVTQEVCTRYKLFSVKFYAKRKENEIVQISSTDDFPIFAFVNKTKEGKEWMKVLQPKSQDKAFRFFHIGGRPKDFVFGLDYVTKKYVEQQEPDEGYGIDDLTDPEPEKSSGGGKLERVVIASGDRDALNLAGAGELVIWLNSETAKFDKKLYADLKNKTKKIINVPDIDQTGRIQGTDLALEYMDIYTAWLPEELAKTKDFRGNPKKDFLDFCSKYRYNTWRMKNEVRLLLDNAKSCQFWDARATKNGWSYDFNNVNAYYFLSLVGFHRMTSPENKEDYVFVRKENHLIYKVNYLQVKDYVNTFLEQKQREIGERIIPNALRNMIYNSTRMAENSLVNLPTISPNFTNAGKHYQLIFFRNQAWKITAKGIFSEDIDKIKENVWVENLIEERVYNMYKHKIDSRKIYIDSPYFTIYKDKENNWDIRINNPDCEFLNYLINTSRVHWAKETDDLTEDKQKKYWKENRFNIAGRNLSEDEVHEQKLHLINKIFIYGYMMHRFKDPSRAWLSWLMDNEIVDDDESHGRTGKSLYSNSLRIFLNTKVIPARNRKLFENNFIFDGITEHTDYLLFDDANKYFDVGNIYTEITGDFWVNPKNNKPYGIPFSESPKMLVSTNFGSRDSSSSTADRLIIGVFSNYYHAEGNGMERRGPQDDFGHMLFNDWDDDQWNKFFNFSAQALQFFLSTPEKISAPDANVIKRNSLAQMGVAFQNWADIFLPDYINNTLEDDRYFNKLEAYENMKQTERSLSSSSAKDFTRKLEHWCTYNDIILDPEEKQTTKDGRIFKWTDGKSVQHHYLLRMNPLDPSELPTTDLDDWF